MWQSQFGPRAFYFEMLCFVIGLTQTASALHPIQRNWEFRFDQTSERPFFISPGLSGVAQRATIDGAIYIDDDDHRTPILRKLDLRLSDVVSVNADTGEIIDPIEDPLVFDGDRLVDVLLNDLSPDTVGTLTETAGGFHMQFVASGAVSQSNERALTQLDMRFIGGELRLSGSSAFTSFDDGTYMLIDPISGWLFVEFYALDFNSDESLDVADLDLLVTAVSDPIDGVNFDLFSDGGVIDNADLDVWLSAAARQNGHLDSYLHGDVNLDGVVDAADLGVVGLNWHQRTRGWSQGDFTGDHYISAEDLNIVGLNWQKTQATAVAEVPEPAIIFPGPFFLALLWAFCRMKF